MSDEALTDDQTGYVSPTFPPKMRAVAGGAHPSLKRSRPSSHPPLPELNGELTLEVFTHRSLRYEGAAMHEEYGDSARLAELGAHVLQMIVTWSLFSKRPMLKADEIATQRDEILGDGNIDAWLTAYKLRMKLRFSSEAMSTLNSPDEGRLLFNSFIGAVYLQHGLAGCQKWISRLIDPDWEPPALPESEVEAKRPRIESAAPPPPSESAPPLPPSPASSMSSFPHTPPPYAPPPASASAAASPVGMAFLPMFNQIANQRRIQVDYPATFSGPPHAGRWNVKCVVNGTVKGEGAAISKQLAKEEAAKQAYFAMGWGARPGSMPPSQQVGSQPTMSSSSPIYTIKQEDIDMSSGTPPPPPSGEAPPPPPAGPPPAFSAYTPTQPPAAPTGTQYLPLFNQIATQRRLMIDYPAEFSGPPHSGRWSVKCLVNGIVKGQGQGSSKQLAKEEAARTAYHAMGWSQSRF